MYDEKAQQEVWGEDDNTLVSSSYAPMGQVTPVEGGFQFSGHWQWSSGSEHCDWALLGGLIFPPEGGAPEYRTFLIPKSDYEIKDTWYSMGLKQLAAKIFMLMMFLFLSIELINNLMALTSLIQDMQ